MSSSVPDNMLPPFSIGEATFLGGEVSGDLNGGCNVTLPSHNMASTASVDNE